METKNGNQKMQKMQLGSRVRYGFYSVSQGGMVYGETIGTIVQMFAAVAFVDFGGVVKKCSTCTLIVV
jgi:hypothetical protein